MTSGKYVMRWVAVLLVLVFIDACENPKLLKVNDEAVAESSVSGTDSSAHLSSGVDFHSSSQNALLSQSNGSSTLSSMSTQEESSVALQTSSLDSESSEAGAVSLSSNDAVLQTSSAGAMSISSDTEQETPKENTEFVNWGLPGLTVPHGFGVNIHFNGSDEHFPRFREDLDLIAEAGIKVIRQDLFWHWIEQEKGVLFWDHFDALVDECEKRGLQLLFILTYSNQLYEEHINSIYTQQGRDAWTHYATTAVERYKGKNIVWELWNEPNLYIFWLPEPDVDAYMALLDQAVPAIRAVDPSAILMASATSHIDLGWIEETFKRGLLNHIDAVSVHPYRHQDPETVIGDYYNLFNLINGYTGGQGKPVVSSEWGYSNINWDDAHLDDWEQARRLVRELLTNISMGIHISIWYDWMNDGTDPNNREHNFGIVENDRVPKLAYYAYKTLNETLYGYTFLQSIDAGSPGVYFLQFGKGDDRIYVFWKTGAEQVRDIQSDIGTVEIVSMMGDRETINWDGTAFPHLFTSSPHYMIVPAGH
ncbi:MAG: glycoside hydrolase family 5 protein [Reichenbachiella sp.]